MKRYLVIAYDGNYYYHTQVQSDNVGEILTVCSDDVIAVIDQTNGDSGIDGNSYDVWVNNGNGLEKSNEH